MKTEILVIGRHSEILQTVVRLVNTNPDWNATGAETDEEALYVFHHHDFALVLLGGGIPKDNEVVLGNAFTAHKPGILIVRHYGGGSGLLSAEIYGALNSRK